jgi:hypothetical protein
METMKNMDLPDTVITEQQPEAIRNPFNSRAQGNKKAQSANGKGLFEY